MTPYDQRHADCRCEWGPRGLDALAPADVIIIVDVLSFTSCVDIAVSREVTVLPYAWKDESAAAFARAHDAELAGKRNQARYSLSPKSFLEAPAGLRCVLPSPNGAALSLRAAANTRSIVLAGSLRNAQAVAAVAARLGKTINVCPAGEQWEDTSLRPAVEDWLGAGAILRHLPGSKSPEAAAAIVAFEQMRDRLPAVLAEASSGRELIERGAPDDVTLAAALDVSISVPRLEGDRFVHVR